MILFWWSIWIWYILATVALLTVIPSWHNSQEPHQVYTQVNANAHGKHTTHALAQDRQAYSLFNNSLFLYSGHYQSEDIAFTPGDSALKTLDESWVMCPILETNLRTQALHCDITETRRTSLTAVLQPVSVIRSPAVIVTSQRCFPIIIGVPSLFFALTWILLFQPLKPTVCSEPALCEWQRARGRRGKGAG